MSKMFAILEEGLVDALEYKKGVKVLRTKHVVVPAALRCQATNIKKIRSSLGVTQTDFSRSVEVGDE